MLEPRFILVTPILFQWWFRPLRRHFLAVFHALLDAVQGGLIIRILCRSPNPLSWGCCRETLCHTMVLTPHSRYNPVDIRQHKDQDMESMLVVGIAALAIGLALGWGSRE